MIRPSTRTAVAIAAGLVAPLAIVIGTVDAGTTTRTTGTGQQIDLGWTEYDPDDVLGLPGNVHVGFLYADIGAYGTFINGSVVDFECDEGEVPWGGHGVIHEEAAEEAGEVADEAVLDVIDDIVDEGGSAIDAGEVVDAVQTELDEQVPKVIEEYFEEIPACDLVQERFLDGTETAQVTVDIKSKTARVTGRLVVSNGGHGEPGQVLATPPIDLTMTGGEWETWESDYSVKGETYKYSQWDKGTRYYGATVTGNIGPMGFADDADDASSGGYSTYRFRTVERVR